MPLCLRGYTHKNMNVLPSWYVEGRKQIDSLYTTQNLANEIAPTVSWSPSRRYYLIVDSYRVGTSIYTRGTVCSNKTDDGRLPLPILVADIKRNHHDFPFAWVNQNGNEYLLTEEDQQSYTVVDLNHKNTQTFVDDNAHEGLGFSWSVIRPSPDGKLLAVTGTYFPDLGSTVVYDFSQPHVLPLPKLCVLEQKIHDDFEIVGWSDNCTLELNINNKKVSFKPKV